MYSQLPCIPINKIVCSLFFKSKIPRSLSYIHARITTGFVVYRRWAEREGCLSNGLFFC